MILWTPEKNEILAMVNLNLTALRVFPSAGTNPQVFLSSPFQIWDLSNPQLVSESSSRTQLVPADSDGKEQTCNEIHSMAQGRGLLTFSNENGLYFWDINKINKVRAISIFRNPLGYHYNPLGQHSFAVWTKSYLSIWNIGRFDKNKPQHLDPLESHRFNFDAEMLSISSILTIDKKMILVQCSNGSIALLRKK